MRLLRFRDDGELTLTNDMIQGIPPYAILSHTWGQGPDDEVTFQDITGRRGDNKPGYQKILFCGQQAKSDGLDYFWVDTCCIDKTNSTELNEAVNSMFRWYQSAQKCYVYLSDVSHGNPRTNGAARSTWKRRFRISRWFTRGWTLQELIAPRLVEFFTSDGQKLGDKQSLEQTIHEITEIPVLALQGTPLADFSTEERISWTSHRHTTRVEDKAYSLLGVLGVYMPLIYGEGDKAFERLRVEISIRAGLPRVLSRLPTAEGASFDSHAEEFNPRCLPDTRIDLLREIDEWTQDTGAKAIYWLNGMAGTGKSTISRTLAHKYAEKGLLGASFFFKRGEGDRGIIAKFFTTIASQLVKRIPETTAHMLSAVDADPDISSKAMREQFDKLIIDPLAKLSSLDSSKRKFLIIIDALEECEQEEGIKLLIKLLSNVDSRKHSTLKFFLTSRPELPIRLGFKAIDGMYQDFILHNIVKSVIEHDMAAFFTHKLSEVRDDFNKATAEHRQLPATWPDATDLQLLTRMASPLFIFAATVCLFIADYRFGSPDDQLREVLEYQTKSQESQLDATYLPVLNQMIAGLGGKKKQKLLEWFQNIVGCIIVLESPLSASALARMIDVPVGQVNGLLDTLHSVLSIPSAPSEPVRLLHLSFRDFLLDPEKRGTTFWVDEKDTHRRLAVYCLRTMTDALHADICNVGDPGAEVSSTTMDSINEKLPPQVQYACRFWSHHLREAGIVTMNEEVLKFLTSHFLHWLEALSWLGRASESIQTLKILQSTPELRSSQDISEFLSDAFRFIYATRSIIEVAPLQIYSSALVFAPSHTRIRLIYESDIPEWLLLRPGVLYSWNQSLQTLEGHTNVVRAVAFSPDGQLIASGSNDGTVRLWATETGALQQILKHEGGIPKSLAFSTDGRRLAAASNYKVNLWAIDTGELQEALEGHESIVYSIAISPNNEYILSGSLDNTVRLWETTTGKVQRVADVNAGVFIAVAFAPNGKQAAVASHKAVLFWDINTGKLQQLDRGHDDDIHSMAFSPDGRWLVLGVKREVEIWAVDTGILVHRFGSEHITDHIRSVAFSLDSQRIATATGDDVRLWSADTTELLQTLGGHTDYVTSIAYSPDGRLLASGSQDNTVRLWAADMHSPQQSLDHHTASAYSFAFSSDSCYVATGSLDFTVLLWATDTGKLQQTFKGHKGIVWSVAFSPNDRFLLSGSQDGTVRLWKVGSGEIVRTFDSAEGPIIGIKSVAFSPDGERIASGSGGGKIHLWATDTGVLQQAFVAHQRQVRSVAFSPDGQRLASGSSDGKVRLWAADTGQLQYSVEVDTDGFRSVAFSPDGVLLAAGTIDGISEGTVRIWDTDAGDLLETLNAKTGSDTLRFGADGKTIVMSLGTFALNTNPDSDAASKRSGRKNRRKPLSYPNSIGVGISRDLSWITYNGRNVMWLPVDCRSEWSAISGNIVVIGCRSGRVIIMRFKYPFS